MIKLDWLVWIKHHIFSKIYECHHLIKVVQAPHMRLEVWAMMIRPVIIAHSYSISIIFIKGNIARKNVNVNQFRR